MKHFWFGILLFFWFSVSLWAQQRQGRIYDSESGKPMALVVVRSGDALAFSDLSGRYSIAVGTHPLEFQYPGYKRTTLYTDAASRNYLRVFLNPLQTNYGRQRARELGTKIQRRAWQSTQLNDPLRKLPPHTLHAYHKLTITAPPDSINGKIDSLFYFRYKDNRIFRKLDSSDYRFKQFISAQHLFITEKASQFRFDGDVVKEEIESVRMGGFRPPIYELSAQKLQSFSLYESKIELAKTRFPGLLTSDAPEHYFFDVIDSLRLEKRKVYVLRFTPKKKKGLQGLLYVDAKNHGLAGGLLYAPGIVSLQAQYESVFWVERQIWVPSHTSLTLAKGQYDRPISIFGYTLSFESEEERAEEFSGQYVGSKKDKFASDFIYAKAQTWYDLPVVDENLKIKHPWVKAEISDEAISRPDTVWRKYASLNPDPRDSKSYPKLDSISGRAGLQWKLQLLRRIILGYVPLGPVDWRLTDLIGYNDYEGLRLGLGGVTNDSFSKRFRIDGYGAYGLVDTRLKYGLGSAWRLGDYSISWLGISHTNDLKEIASTEFATDKRKIRLYDGRPFNLTTFYKHETSRIYLESRWIPKTHSLWQLSHSHVQPLFIYAYDKGGKLLQEYRLTTAQMSLQWNPRSEFAQTPIGRLETDKGYPRIALQYTHSFEGILGSDLQFGKLDFRVEYQKRFLGGQRFSALLTGGWSFGEVPITELFNTTPNNPRKGSVWERIRPGTDDGFETMFFNEFFTSRFTSLQIRQVSQRFRISRSIKPAIGIVSRVAYGDLNRQWQHIGIPIRTLEKGYFESGLELHAIYSGLGIGCYYRYGKYSLPVPQDNFSIKINLSLGLGF